MSETVSQPDSSYLLRKLHSLTGIIPVGAFLAEHFWSNSSALVSADKYNQVSAELQTIPFRLFVEWAFIFLPILFHGGYGVWIWLRGKVERFAISVGEKLVVHRATLDRSDRVCVYRLALVHRALADAWEIDIRRRG